MQITARDSDLIRFASKVQLPDAHDLNDSSACWLWQGAAHGQGRGYGKFWLNGKMISAHKASYLLFVGPVEEGNVIGHQCNDERCVNPAHLKQETQSENIKYCVKSGRHNSQKRNHTATEIKVQLVSVTVTELTITLAEVEEVAF